MLLGALVIASRKGTKKHKKLGYGFFGAMVLMNITALFTHSLYFFGPFHWMAMGSLALVSCGIGAPLFFRRYSAWRRVHYDLMLWSYVGLIAAFFSEIIVRVPLIGVVTGGGTLFWNLVVGISVATFAVGGYFIERRKKHHFRPRSGLSG
jgi:uncharacterized membrane protein